METAERQRAPESGGLAIPAEGRLTLRTPTVRDGLPVNALIAACPPLDPNSAYCNLLQCTHFAQTCVVATIDDELAGWVSAYLPPDQEDAVFVWQVAVAASARGRGLGRRMLAELLARDACKAVRRLTTTITPDNKASWALFAGLATSLDAALDDTPWLIEGQHLPPGHATEHLVTIGPFAPNRA
jgi:L-2,4-diaminobutyric acid acetyltransferase